MKRFVEPEFIERKVHPVTGDGGIYGSGTFKLTTHYSITDEEIVRGMEEDIRKVSQQRSTDIINDELEKIFIRGIETSDSNVFISRHANRRTVVMHPMRIPIISPRMDLAEVSEFIQWLEVEIYPELCKEILEKISHILANNIGWDGCNILIPPKKFTITEGQIEDLEKMNGMELCQFMGTHTIFISTDVDDIVVVEKSKK